MLWNQLVHADLTGPQFALLSAVGAQPGLDQTAARTFASLDKATAAGIVSRLARDGWLAVETDPADRRRKRLDLPRSTRSALRVITAQVQDVQRALLDPLTPPAREALLTGLSALAHADTPPDELPRPDTRQELGVELATSPGHLIRTAQQTHTTRWKKRFGSELTGPQYAVLCVLAAAEPRDQSGVGEAASIDKSSIVEVVDRLRARGLVDAAEDPAYRRRKVLRLSAVARVQLPEITERAAAVQADLTALVPATVRDDFLEALSVVASHDVDRDSLS